MQFQFLEVCKNATAESAPWSKWCQHLGSSVYYTRYPTAMITKYPAAPRPVLLLVAPLTCPLVVSYSQYARPFCP